MISRILVTCVLSLIHLDWAQASSFICAQNFKNLNIFPDQVPYWGSEILEYKTGFYGSKLAKIKIHHFRAKMQENLGFIQPWGSIQAIYNAFGEEGAGILQMQEWSKIHSTIIQVPTYNELWVGLKKLNLLLSSENTKKSENIQVDDNFDLRIYPAFGLVSARKYLDGIRRDFAFPIDTTGKQYLHDSVVHIFAMMMFNKEFVRRLAHLPFHLESYVKNNHPEIPHGTVSKLIGPLFEEISRRIDFSSGRYHYLAHYIDKPPSLSFRATTVAEEAYLDGESISWWAIKFLEDSPLFKNKKTRDAHRAVREFFETFREYDLNALNKTPIVNRYHYAMADTIEKHFLKQVQVAKHRLSNFNLGADLD